MIVSKRLKTIASFLPESCMRAADIGTDHGYLPIFALKEGLAAQFIAMDVRKGPLSRAERNIEAEGLSGRVDLRLSDGFSALEPGEVQCAVVAGMGGELMTGILERGREVVQSLERLILSPQSELYKVRSWLSEHDFSFLREEMLLEDGKEYVIMVVKPGGGRPLSLAEQKYGPCLLAGRHPLMVEKLQKERERTEKLIRELSGLKKPQETEKDRNSQEKGSLESGCGNAVEKRLSQLYAQKELIEEACYIMGRN